jgi:hypothetical protein
MNLIKQIRDDILDPNIGLSTVLRKAKVLASLLRDADFKEWINHELDGYPDAMDMPGYRVIPVQNIGTFSGAFGRGIENASLPAGALDESVRDAMWNVHFNNGVRHLESLAEGEEPILYRQWPHEAIELWNYANRTNDLALVGAQSRIPRSVVEGILDTTRNKLLDFILELQQIDPDVIESEKAVAELPRDQVSNVFNYTVYGNHNVLAAGNEVSQSVSQSVARHDQASLTAYFRDHGVAEEDLAELVQAVEADGQPRTEEFGSRVRTWMGTMIAKAFQGSWKVALDTAPKLITEGISSYYGWGSTAP